MKPEFLRHEGLQELEVQFPELRPMLVFEGLWTQSDREGRFEWRPRQLKLDILPFVPFALAESLAVLEKGGHIVRYEVAGKVYGWIPGFHEHQRPHHTESASRLPVPPLLNGELTVASPLLNRELPAGSGSGSGSGREKEVEVSTEGGARVLGVDSPLPNGELTVNSRRLVRVEPDPDMEYHVRLVASLYPSARKIGNTIPPVIAQAIHDAIEQDGYELVKAGTENYSDAVHHWPKDELRFVAHPEGFYREKQYLHDPATWSRSTAPKQSNVSRAVDEFKRKHMTAAGAKP